MGTQTTIVAVLEQHGREKSSHVAYRYLEDGDNESACLTFEELTRGAKKFAAYLQSQGLRHQNVVLAVKHELAFLESLLGCFYSGAVAVPVTIPRRDRQVEAFERIVDNADARVLILSRTDSNLHAPLLNAAARSSWRIIYIEDVSSAPASLEISCEPDDLAFLQYTSGSTGIPKGVKISHGNLLANERAIKQAMQLGEKTVFVSWLPLFHDMGLVGSALQPLFLGVTCVLMPPQAFLMKPQRWLTAISRYHGTTSGAPNFAYELCISKITAAQRSALDLSSWSVAFNGSEPVRAATLDRFAEEFATVGFKRSAFYPCYGLAESTLIVSGPVPGSNSATARFQSESLQLGSRIIAAQGTESAKAVVPCGQVVQETELRVVNPDTRQTVPVGHVGEIWIRGASVTSGYYGAPEKDALAFGLLDENQGPPQSFLRTGDLGCFHEKNLFVLGRLKDLIIVRGRKYYPQDLEATATMASSLLAAGAVAAFAIEDEFGESLAIVHELTRQGWRTADPAELCADIRQSLIGEYGVTATKIALIKPGTLPCTTSGKVRRAYCRELLLADGFECLVDRQSAAAESREHFAEGTAAGTLLAELSGN